MEHDETEAAAPEAAETEVPAVITCSGGVTLPSLGIPGTGEADGA